MITVAEKEMLSQAVNEGMSIDDALALMPSDGDKPEDFLTRSYELIASKFSIEEALSVLALPLAELNIIAKIINWLETEIVKES